jgi:hypothetical protein
MMRFVPQHILFGILLALTLKLMAVKQRLGTGKAAYTY